MWRLWNKLFGWHYVRIQGYGGVFRVLHNVHGHTAVRDRRWTSVFILYENGKAWPTDEYKEKRVIYIPLTFKPEELIK